MEQLSTAQKITQSLRTQVGAKRGTAAVCLQCKLPFVSTHCRGQIYCSRSCASIAKHKNTPPEEAAVSTKKMIASLKGKPAWNKGIPCREETKFKISAAHIIAGRKPPVLGGNGRPNECEQLAAEMLPSTWVHQFAIPTKQPRDSGYPTCYKVDFANPRLMKVLEIDGNSHASRKHLDAKKDSFLASLGWSVFRVTNNEIRSMYTTFKSTGHTTILSKVR